MLHKSEKLCCALKNVGQMAHSIESIGIHLTFSFGLVVFRYYPIGHKAYLRQYPDVLGQKMRSVTRTPLWERARSNEKDADEGASQKSWWNDEWLSTIENNTANYPILCLVERSYAEFPPDPYTKSVQKIGANGPVIKWKAPKDTSVLRGIPGSPLRWSVMLRPLTSVLPPTSFLASASESLSLPPTFNVITFPHSQLKPFLYVN
jgi:hypothetical protein